MMLCRWLASIVCLLFAAGIAVADSRPIVIKSVQLGMPAAGPAGHLFKAAKWAPVWVQLEVASPIDDETIDIRVATPDGDDLISQARVTFPRPEPGATVSHVAYLKPGSVTSEVTVDVLRSKDGQQLAKTFSNRLIGLPPSRHLILSVGTPLTGLRLTKAEGQASEGLTEQDPIRNGWVHLAHIVDFKQLPDRWFGYDAVDLLILNPVEPAFWQAFLNDTPRVRALAEWVHRGGRIMIAGKACYDVDRILRGFPAKFDRAHQRTMNEIALVLPNSPRLILKPPAAAPISLAVVNPDAARTDRVKLLTDEREQPTPLVLQFSEGLGRVTLVAFDLDEPSFREWPHRETFWDWLLNLAGTRLPSGADAPSTTTADNEDQYLNRLQNNLDFFEGVPVISFGWVALLILAYILLIGPLEYLVLKKLFKRLEWTWLTLPLIAGSACVFAYIAAVEVKGRELRLNKVDLVDIDMRGKRVYGQSWFTLFSPRIDRYTIGVEPTLLPESPSDTLVSWHGKAKNARQSLFRRAYNYQVNKPPGAYADALEQVPVQIWSTKSFMANWSAPLEKPLIESTLRLAAADPNQITGSITSHLPAEWIPDARLIYRERIVPLPPLMRGVPRFVSTSPLNASAVSWLHNEILHKDLIASTRITQAAAERFDDDPRFRIWPILFHELVQGQFNRLAHGSFRSLDQSWRVHERHPREAILIVRFRNVEGPAEEIGNSPESPTRLWLNAIPGHGVREPIAGRLRQETYLRVIIPIE